MIDLHSHVLPRIDDGAKSVDISLQMLAEAKRQGVETVAATPHCVTDKDEGVSHFLNKRQKAYEILCEAIKEDGGDYPQVILGAEVYLGCDVSEFTDLSKLCYQNTKYILLEMANGYSPSELAEWVYNVKIKGYHPVIAHIDRYTKYKEIMDEFSSLNVIYQVNASEFYTLSGRMLLRNIFKRHNKFYVSSDMHNLTSRVCNIKGAYDLSCKKFPSMTEMLFENGAKCIIENRKFEHN